MNFEIFLYRLREIKQKVTVTITTRTENIKMIKKIIKTSSKKAI